MSSSYAAMILSAKPQLYYRMDDTASTLHDISGNAHNGSISGGVVEGSPGAIFGDPDTSMLFDGATGFANVSPGYVTSGSGFSVSLWVKLSNNTFSSYPCLLANDFPSSTKTGVSLFLAPSTDGASGYFQIGFTGSFVSLGFGVGVLAAGVWYQIVAVYDSAAMRLYINGSQVAHVSASGSIGTPGSAISIARYPGDSGYVPGYLDEIACFATGLTPTQIASQYTTALASTLVPSQRHRHFGRVQ